MKKIIILVSLIGLVFTSCKDDDSPEPGDTQVTGAPKYSTQQVNLTYGATKIWKLQNTHLYGKTPQGQVLDQDLQLGDCALDNRYTFTIAGDCTSDTGDEKCDPSEEQTVTSKWKFIDDKNFIWNDKEMEIITLTDQEFTVRYPAEIDFGIFTIDGIITNTYIPE